MYERIGIPKGGGRTVERNMKDIIGFQAAAILHNKIA